ncbi:alpha/beta fold hydrolase [Erythrobacter sp.]|uniref:alpha/beta fold hydrolase n=1 Tax=Erythrobacter sp. TaxID=1042 RepID=UPI00311F17B4
MEEHRVISGDVELAVHVTGEGPSVLLIHGFPDDHEVWENQVPALVAAGYRVIAPDTRGCGNSSIPASVADFRIDRLVADMIAVLDHFGIAKALLVAHDWGALIGWRLAIAHPERIERYVALSVGHPAALGAGGLRQMLKSYYIFLFQIRGLGEWLMRGRNWRMVRAMARTPQEAQRAVDRLSRRGRLTAGIDYYRANIRMFRQRDVPHCTGVPVLGVASEGDPYITERPMRETGRFVDGPFRFELVRNAGHWLQRDAPETVNSLLVDFLGSDLTNERAA